MKEKNLLASVALFSELYNSNSYNSIFDILAEFIKSALLRQQKYSFNSREVKALLETEYGFRIPEQVIRTTLGSRLKDCITRKDGVYHLESSKVANVKDLLNDVSSINQSQANLIRDIEAYIEQRNRIQLTEKMKEEIFENFNHILLDNGYSDKYSDLISAYIILKEKDPEFLNALNSIREGLIMYQGIIYTSDINELGKWSSDLVIYLNTDELFSALGYDGVLFEEIFQDFHKLVNEINLSTEKGKFKKIQLKFFEETQIEVDNIFYVAEAIKRGTKKLDPRKGAAMKFILDGCSTVADVKAKKVRFELDLKRLGIQLEEFNHSWERVSKYNVQDQTILEELKKNSLEKGRQFDENLCLQYFKIFTKINYFRKGESNKSLEKIGHIFITENSFAKYIAHNNAVKFADNDLPFAKGLDYITTKFWFKLKKGFSDKQVLPKSFNVITKAKLILSAHMRASVSEEYQKLVREVENGSLTTDELMQRSYDFREKPIRPEDITLDNVESTIDFLNDESFFDNLSRERQKNNELLTESQIKIKELETELNARKEIDKNAQIAKEKFDRDLQISIVVDGKLKEAISQKKKNCLYFIMTYLPEILIVMIGFSLKGYKPLDNYMIGLGNYQWFVWALLALFFATHVYMRSHVYNKDRIKDGLDWFKKAILLNTKSYKYKKREELLETEIRSFCQ